MNLRFLLCLGTEVQTERAKRMDSAGEEASLNSPELPWNQLYLKRRTESRIQLRRRVCFTGPAAAAVTVVLAILILAAGSVSSDSEFVKVPSSVNCTEGQDCILSCSFDYTAGGWDMWSYVVWRREETSRIVHSYHDNTDQLAHQLPQYVNRTGLFDSELQRGNASMLLRRVREEDAGNYSCSVYPHKLHGSGLIELVLVPAQPTSAAITAEPTSAAMIAEPTSAAAAVLNGRHPWWVSGAVLVYWVAASFCIGLKLYIQRAGCCFWKSHDALKAQYSAGQDSETQ
ncbi:butyrophilin subfamily 1 member A1-like [Acipenser ruthenus]|uniref:butyrophilin subfamily 1 member A1-like n=1 Tax=Acipenser ruthenus TaxID=7906 RepID=UPI00274123F7|nr:butyrophilin subfamily 1 member A1-like [Acipenser ruthenus]